MRLRAGTGPARLVGESQPLGWGASPSGCPDETMRPRGGAKPCLLFDSPRAPAGRGRPGMSSAPFPGDRPWRQERWCRRLGPQKFVRPIPHSGASNW